MFFDAGHGTSELGTTLRQTQGPVSRLASRSLASNMYTKSTH